LDVIVSSFLRLLISSQTAFAKRANVTQLLKRKMVAAGHNKT